MTDLERERDALREERATLFLNKRINDAFQTALERGELFINQDGFVTARQTLERTDNA